MLAEYVGIGVISKILLGVWRRKGRERKGEEEKASSRFIDLPDAGY